MGLLQNTPSCERQRSGTHRRNWIESFNWTEGPCWNNLFGGHDAAGWWGSNWQNNNEYFGMGRQILCMKKCTDGDSHVTTPVALLFCLNHRNHKTCVPSMDALWGHETSPSGGARSYWWHEEKCLRFEKAVWTAATASSDTTKPFHLFGPLTWALAVKGDAFITCLHMFKQFTTCCFRVNAPLHLRKQGSRKVQHASEHQSL